MDVIFSTKSAVTLLVVTTSRYLTGIISVPSVKVGFCRRMVTDGVLNIPLSGSRIGERR
jgi:hypothetical protein